MNDNPVLTESTYYILLSLYTPQHGYGIMQRAEALSGGTIPNGLERILIEKVAPSILEARARGMNSSDDFERQHIIETVVQIKHRLAPLRDGIAEGSCGIVGLRYKLSDGSVEHVIADGVE